VTNVFSSDEEKDGSLQDSSQQSQESYAELPVGQQVNKTHEEFEIKQLRREKKQLQIKLKEKIEEIAQQKLKIKEQSQCIEDLKSQEEVNAKEHQVLSKQELEMSDKIVKYEAKITSLEREINCLQVQLQKVLKENKSLTMVPTRDYGPRISRSTSCRTQRLHKIEELKSEINKTDTAMRDTLNQIAQISKDMRDPSSRMRRTWKSEMKLQLEYHHSSSSFVHSQV